MSARLLICGILDNTLNFEAKVTTRRDIDAYTELLKRADLPDDWTAQYFSECQEAILNDITNAIRNDTKTIGFRTFDNTPTHIGQLVVWNATQVLLDYKDLLETTLKARGADWFMNLVSIEEGKSYFITDNQLVQQWLANLLNIEFDGSIAIADRLWLRKEIIQQDITNFQS